MAPDEASRTLYGVTTQYWCRSNPVLVDRPCLTNNKRLPHSLSHIPDMQAWQACTVRFLEHGHPKALSGQGILLRHLSFYGTSEFGAAWCDLLSYSYCVLYKSQVSVGLRLFGYCVKGWLSSVAGPPAYGLHTTEYHGDATYMHYTSVYLLPMAIRSNTGALLLAAFRHFPL